MSDVEAFFSSKHQATAGVLAGMVTYVVMYPVDLLKTRMQILRPTPKAVYTRVLKGLMKIKLNEGFLPLFRGIMPQMVAFAPAHVFYYLTYEKMQHVLRNTEHGTSTPMTQGTAVIFAIIGHHLVMNPAEVLKQRMQVYGSPYRSSLFCLQDIVRKEGIYALFRSLPTNLIINCPHAALQFVLYEIGQNVYNPNRGFDGGSHIASAAIASGIAAAVTTPLDVCRTLLNLQEFSVKRGLKKSVIRGLPSAVVTVYRLHGIKGFLKGLNARVVYTVPSSVICWYAFEFFKHSLSDRQQ